MPLFRRTTNSSLQSASEAQRRPTFPHETRAGKVQDRFPVYEGFPWEKIEEYLKTKWPSWTEYNPQRVNDSWEFEVPNFLSEGDREALRELRDEHLRKRRDSVTPER